MSSISDKSKRGPLLALVGALIGLVFAAFSTSDYAAHTDRQIHEIHCSFIPGQAASSDVDNPCRTALYSSYSAILRGTFWGGIPISLFAAGTFLFLLVFALFLLLSPPAPSAPARRSFAWLTTLPLLASGVMFLISLLRLGSFCKVCVGIYVASILVAVGGAISRETASSSAQRAPRMQGVSPLQPGQQLGQSRWLLPVAVVLGLGVSTLLPAMLYASALPDVGAVIRQCGSLAVPEETHHSLLRLATSAPVQKATLFVDPLCPTCKAFHQRLASESILENLDVSLALFPLDSECNWMLGEPLHPGACVVSRALLCSKNDTREMLEWMYDHQEELQQLAKVSVTSLKAKIADKWGKEVVRCADARATDLTLSHHLQYAVANHVPISTPQMFLGSQRVCEEDTDLGLRYTLSRLAPQVVR